MPLEAMADIAIAKPRHEVFEAIVDPAQMSRYFISSASGRPQPGEIIHWRFDDVKAGVDVRVLDVQQDRLFKFVWPPIDGAEVSIQVAEDAPGLTSVTVTEGTWEPDSEGIATYGEQLKGWEHFLLCLKAMLEYGVNLRRNSITLRHKKLIERATAGAR